MRSATLFYQMSSGAVFHEITISHPYLLGVSHISGPVDYMLASTVGDLQPEETRGVAVPDEGRRFLVVEAKQSATLTLNASLSQLLAQILTIQHADQYNPFLIEVAIRERHQHAGVLTDGREWRFFMFSRKEDEVLLHSSGSIQAVDKKSCEKVIGNTLPLKDSDHS
jgi:hypothetical protein